MYQNERKKLRRRQEGATAPIHLGKLATAIQAKRKAMGLTLEQAAADLALHYTTLSEIENEKQVPSLTAFTSLCRWLDMPMDHFALPAEQKVAA